MLSNCQRDEADEFDDDQSMLTKLPRGEVTVQLGELLYPSFNQIVPQFVEFVIPQLSNLS